MKSKKDLFLNEPLSKEFKERVFNSVSSELEANKKYSKSTHFKFGQLFAPALGCLALAGIIFYKVYFGLGVPHQSNSIMDLAALTPEEIQVIDDLDFIEALDELSPEELEELL